MRNKDFRTSAGDAWEVWSGSDDAMFRIHRIHDSLDRAVCHAWNIKEDHPHMVVFVEKVDQNFEGEIIDIP